MMHSHKHLHHHHQKKHVPLPSQDNQLLSLSLLSLQNYHVPWRTVMTLKTQLRRDANHAVSLVMVIACKTDFFAPHATMRECNNKRKIAKRKEVLSKRHPQQPNPLPKSQECPLDYLRLGNQVIPQQHRKPNPTNLHRKRGRMLLCLLAYQQPQSVLLREEPRARETHWCEQRSAWCRKQ